MEFLGEVYGSSKINHKAQKHSIKCNLLTPWAFNDVYIMENFITMNFYLIVIYKGLAPHLNHRQVKNMNSVKCR